MSLEPIRHEMRLACAPEAAFSTYTERIGAWWDARYTANPETLQAVTIEPRSGGRVYATHSDCGDDDWGVVTVWEPGRALEHSFTLAQDARYPTAVAIEFLGDKRDACVVRFVHGGWHRDNEALREKFTDWPVILSRFAALAGTSADRVANPPRRARGTFPHAGPDEH